MSTVYGNAKQTAVYLGECDEATKVLLSVARDEWETQLPSGYAGYANWLSECGVHMGDYLKKERESPCASVSLQGVEGTRDPGLGHSIINWLQQTASPLWNAFFTRPWFLRTWIVQETMLSSAFVVVFGEEEILWHTVMVVTEAMQEMKALLHGNRHPSRNQVDENFTLPPIIAMRRSLGLVGGKALYPQSGPSEYQTGLKLWRLLSVLRLTSRFDCRDPRDKLYAILPLFERPIPKLLVPDYSKTTEEVYADCTWFLLSYDDPDVLLLAGQEQGETSMPSWVVDWRLPGKPGLRDQLLPPSWRGASLRGSENVCESPYRAGFVQDQRQIHARRDGEALILRGLVIGPDVPDSNVLKDKELICVLLGFREPYKMRALRDGWELVGNCFVPLLMDGEALAHFDWETAYAELPVTPLQDFRIY
ncbi:hypothetical protein LTR37_020662 [Vermiconidia calcicola]|uniref:Uncharacterized protein n=1 Tax=Vermiconidia calcicola TaxID=1690605 RepID=A0ACC3MAM3_9PEZI|nr:hypothetical protein LTR37_020662 [Vermiconidia calcicola]